MLEDPGPSADRRRIRTVIAVVAAGTLALLGTAVYLFGPAAEPVPLLVSPSGADDNDGRTPSTPLRTIQAALDAAVPGSTINLAPGVYRENLTTVRDGAPDAPITTKGPETGKKRAGRYRAVLFGTGRAISNDHS